MTAVEVLDVDNEIRPLRVLVIAERDPFNSHLLRALFNTCKIEHVLTAVANEQPVLQRLKALKPSARAGLELARSITLKVIDMRLDNKTRAELACGRFWPDCSSVVSQTELLAGRGKEILSEVQPDLLVLSGAPLLPSRLFSMPRLGTVNLHCGLPNRYRGNHGLLFPLLRQEYDAIGSTLHYVDDGIDTGALLAQGRPSITSSDTLASVLAKTAQISALMLAEFISALGQRPVAGSPIAERGQLIRNRDRRVWHYIRLGFNRHLAIFRPIHLAEDVRRYY